MWVIKTSMFIVKLNVEGYNNLSCCSPIDYSVGHNKHKIVVILTSMLVIMTCILSQINPTKGCIYCKY